MIDKSWREGNVIENSNGGCVMCSADEVEKIMEAMLEKQEKIHKMQLVMERQSGINLGREWQIEDNIRKFRDLFCSPTEEI